MAAVNDLDALETALNADPTERVVIPPGGPTRKSPYFHEPAPEQSLRTDCGNNTSDGAELDRGHAVGLGYKPCPRCYPEAAGDAS